MESAHQQRTVAQPFSSTHSPRLFPNSASTQRPLRPFTLLAPSLEGSLEGRVILCSKNAKTAMLTTFRINTCKSVSKQRTLTPFRMNTYEKRGGGGCLSLSCSSSRSLNKERRTSPLHSAVSALFLKTSGCGGILHSGNPK